MATGGYPIPQEMAGRETPPEGGSTPSSMPELEPITSGSSQNYTEKGIKEPSEKDTKGFIPEVLPRRVAGARRRGGVLLPRMEYVSDPYSTTSSETDPRRMVHWLHPPPKWVYPYECATCGQEFRLHQPLHEHIIRYHKAWRARCLGSIGCARVVYFSREALDYHQRMTGHKGIQFQQEGVLDLTRLSST